MRDEPTDQELKLTSNDPVRKKLWVKGNRNPPTPLDMSGGRAGEKRAEKFAEQRENDLDRPLEHVRIPGLGN